MEHSVRITPRAYDNIDGIVAYIAQDSPTAALRWRDSILSKIGSLKHFPLRHGLAPEAQAVGIDVRQTIHGAYRILYMIEGDTVMVHGVRHGASRPLRPDELPGQS